MDTEANQAAAADYDIFYHPDLMEDPPRLVSLLTDARVLVVRNRIRVDCDLLEAANRLEVFGRLGVGLANIDRDTCRRALGLGMTLCAYGPCVPAEHPAWRNAVRKDSLAAPLEAAVGVSLHVPLTGETRQLFD